MDYETDGKIQNTIATEFTERTILCIARTFHLNRLTPCFPDHHVDRLRTILSYDHICVLDAGTIAVCIFWLSVQTFRKNDNELGVRYPGKLV